ncbi:hypothetical protein X750_03515 [Mesorhizobium sp. LNJC394B00]|nr:hypothetical protein X750_03515 [Mesorhizobium sp. LNJC394B00]
MTVSLEQVQAAPDRLAPVFALVPRFHEGEGKVVLATCGFERLGQQARLMEILLPLGPSARPESRGDDQLVDGVALGRGDQHRQARAMQERSPDGVADKEIQKSAVFL